MKVALVMPPAPAAAEGFWYLQSFAADVFAGHEVSAWLCIDNTQALPWRGAQETLFCMPRQGDEAAMLAWLHDMFELEKPDLVLVYGNIAGHTLAARLAVRFDCACFADAAGLRCGEAITVWKHACSSNVLWQFNVERYPFVLCAAPERTQVPHGTACSVPCVRDFGAVQGESMVSRLLGEAVKNPLEDAGLVCIGGRGLGGAENADKLHLLAQKLGAAVGFSRAAAMNGWGAMDAVVGQSGLRVRTGAVCLALGVSGSAAFLAGLTHARTLIAVNTDPDAPIFRRADIGLVADAGEILERLLKE